MAYLLLHVFDQFYYIYTSLKNRNSMIGFIKFHKIITHHKIGLIHELLLS